LDELRSYTNYLSAHASWFGISSDALSEIEETTELFLRDRALQLASESFWIDRRVDFCETRGGGGLGHLLSVNDLVREFGQMLYPVLVEAGEAYVEMLTRTILEHRGRHKPVRWKLIAEQAATCCCIASGWAFSSEWVGKMLGTAGFVREEVNARVEVIFETVLLGWGVIFRPWDDREPFETFNDVALRKIRHVVRLAPKASPKRYDGEWTESSVPSLTELRSKSAITQRRAAHHLRCDRRTIRRYFKIGELTKTERGLVVCDDKLTRKLQQKFGPTVN
jgi:hypothetical protein